MRKNLLIIFFIALIFILVGCSTTSTSQTTTTSSHAETTTTQVTSTTSTTDEPEVESVRLNESEVSLEVDEVFTLVPTVTPDLDGVEFVWESSDEDVATVSNGVVTAVGVGEAVITVTVKDTDIQATARVIVTEELPTEVGIQITTQPTKLTYFVGETFDPTGLVVEVTYSDTTTAEITNYTLDKTVLTIGDTVVTVSYLTFTATIDIVVEEPGPTTIFIAGDSTVKTYPDNQFNAGWGQFLSLFLDDEEVIVKNMAEGGRSSRSFINEGRLYDNGSTLGKESIESTIKPGDYLFIQFGHNDDATKQSYYSSMFDRMVPLGEPDANGIYPVTPGVLNNTTYLPADYTNLASDAEETAALSTISAYGDTYYPYDSGSYKWYLKEYIDFARSKGAIPVLITPVARVKFNTDGTIASGPGLHGDDFGYVKAVRQLADEEDVLLIDLFAETKTILETAQPSQANYLMALKPNSKVGSWPTGYDSEYQAGSYDGVDGTHYNKYGAFITTAKLVENLIDLVNDQTTVKGTETIKFGQSISTTPESYVSPSALMTRQTVYNLTDLFLTVDVLDEDTYNPSPETVIAMISALENLDISTETYSTVKPLIEAAREAYLTLNIDVRDQVTNLSILEAAEVALEAAKPVYTTIKLNVSNMQMGTYTDTITEGIFSIYAKSDKSVVIDANNKSALINEENLSFTHRLKLGGTMTYGESRYVEFTIESHATITIAAMSSSSSAVRTLVLNNAQTGLVQESSLTGTELNVVSINLEPGTYYFGSSSSGINLYYIELQFNN